MYLFKKIIFRPLNTILVNVVLLIGFINYVIVNCTGTVVNSKLRKLSSCATTVLHAHADIFVKHVQSFFRHGRSRSLVEDKSFRKACTL